MTENLNLHVAELLPACHGRRQSSRRGLVGLRAGVSLSRVRKYFLFLIPPGSTSTKLLVGEIRKEPHGSPEQQLANRVPAIN
jgi:hypothetical protein